METESLNLKKLGDHFNNETKTREFFEQLRWPEGPVCPHCGEISNATRLEGRPDSKKPARAGLYKCNGCRGQFSVTVGTVFEDSHVPLSKWLLAIHLLCASKKGMRAHQLHRMIGVTYKTAWFMFHRLRHAMTQHPMIDKLKGIVEIDEPYVGPKEKGKGNPGMPTPERSKKRPVVALMERGENDSRVRSFHVVRLTLANIKPIIKEHVKTGTNIQTDEAIVYHFMRDDFPQDDVVTHARKEYSRRENGRQITTNTVEGYFGLVKRGVYGTYHHLDQKYLQQYLNEFDFRWNNRKVSDGKRAAQLLKSAESKRLMLRDSKQAVNQ